MKAANFFRSGAILFPLSILALLAGCACAPPEFNEELWERQTGAPDPSLLYAAHTDSDGAFFNPWMERSPQRSGGSFFFRKKMKFDAFPEENYAHVENNYEYLADGNFDSISFAGHASVIIKMNGETVFADPFFSGRAAVVEKKVKIKIDFSKVPESPVVLISHNHYDHLDAGTVRDLVKKDAAFIVPLGLKDFFTGAGAREVHELDWWQSVKIGQITYTLLPAQHWSRRLWQGRNKTLWGGFLIQGSKTIYFSGDTGYFCGFEEFGRKYEIDYALLGAGAYEPRWFMHYAHMNTAEFIKAAGALRAKTAIPIHFGVISLSDEPLVYPLYEIDEFIKKNPRCAEYIKMLRVGEYLRF